MNPDNRGQPMKEGHEEVPVKPGQEEPQKVNVNNSTRPNTRSRSGHSLKAPLKGRRPARRGEALLNVVDQQIFAKKTALDRSFNGLKQVCDRQKDFMQEFQDHCSRKSGGWQYYHHVSARLNRARATKWRVHHNSAAHYVMMTITPVTARAFKPLPTA
ncbi:hypothetical protein V3C99_005930 [Haemonchus contortus]|uniref:Transposase n=1 Tax=Haemonchus contortus TaxID=6289 RepID=A0A7I4XST3_HAECO